jgi:hypothetical protein
VTSCVQELVTTTTNTSAGGAAAHRDVAGELARCVSGGRALETMSVAELTAAQLAVSDLAARLARATHDILQRLPAN